MKNFNKALVLWFLFSVFCCSPPDMKQSYNKAYSLAKKNTVQSWQKANLILKDLLSYNKKNDTFLAFYALSEMKQGNNVSAERAIKDAIKINKNNDLYYYFLANIYYQSSSFVKASSSLKRCLRINPDNVLAFILLVKVEFKINAYELKNVINDNFITSSLESSKFGNLPEALYILAGRHYHHNEMTKAFLLLKRAEKMAPQSPTTLLNLAVVCDIRQNKKMARRYYLRYLEKTGRNKKYLNTRVQVKKRLKQL